MSTLQTSLIVTGIVLLLLYAAWNAWVLYRNRPRQPRPDDAGPALSSTWLGAFPDERKEPSLHGADTPGGGVAAPAARRGAMLDPLIDAIAQIAPEQPVSGSAALQAMPPTRRVGSKTFSIEGLNEATGQWEIPQAGQCYSAFQAGVQLANRVGALNEIEYSEFVMKVQGFANAINAEPDFPDMLEVIENARSLDHFAGEHDAQLVFTLRTRGTSWSTGYIQQHAMRLGFVPGVMPGRMVMPAAEQGDPPLLALGFDSQAAMSEDPATSAVREFTLSLDVAQTPREARPFDLLCSVASTMADAMDGIVAGHNKTPLTPEMMQQTAQELELLYDRLTAREIPAGSTQARRLFS